jgi:hypothetical protein
VTTDPRIETIVADYIAHEPDPGLVGKARRVGKQPALRRRTLIRSGAIAAGVAAATAVIGGGVYLAASNNAQSSPVQPASLTSQPSNPAAALPSSTAPAAAPPPDTAPIQGTGTANQDPSGSCSGRPNTITFPATVQIQGGVLHITDPGGETSGAINADGTADLNGQSESYHLLSSQGTTLQLSEVNGGCSFLTTIALQQPLPPLAGGVVPQITSTATADPAAVWQALLDPFSAAVASRDTSYLFNHLDPAVFQVYTADQCRASLAQPAPDATLRFSVLSVNGPAPWPYAAKGQTITVSAVYTVDANVTANGKTARETHHFTLHNGQMGWFTQCTTTG